MSRWNQNVGCRRGTAACLVDAAPTCFVCMQMHQQRHITCVCLVPLVSSWLRKGSWILLPLPRYTYTDARPHAHAVAVTISIATPPPRMTAEEEARLMARVMEDSMRTDDERQWEGLEEMTALSAAGDVAILELEMVPKEEVREEPSVAAFHPGLVGQGWSWSCTAEQMAAAAVGGVNWCPTSPQL
ncbi:uncharacterized protein LOC125553569 [Triticum urartu]|uniref:uncharacterized protein LOC125553568 n=1 Tax=Triticum urartu TaxID=4572 RepID=UPI0020434C8B|nr:uncharacterized protein LOC125553568 [Triticum urartu]XP_048573294.1 uncharacterized protein LOC125553569 [Triticum urartu]